VLVVLPFRGSPVIKHPGCSRCNWREACKGVGRRWRVVGEVAKLVGSGSDLSGAERGAGTCNG
jgi:hypothetical protein